MVQKLEEESLNAEDEKRAAQEELETLRHDQDDLMVLLSDQEEKMKTYKEKLIELGHPVSLTHMHCI